MLRSFYSTTCIMFHRTLRPLVRCLSSYPHATTTIDPLLRPRCTNVATPNESFVCRRKAPHDFVLDSAVVYENIIGQEEGTLLTTYIHQKMKRQRFQQGHWDAVISGYREIELDMKDPSILFSISPMMDKIREHLEQSHFTLLHDTPKNDNPLNPKKIHVSWLPCHAIHLRHNGILSAHVDSIKFSGKIVAGLSLLSSSIMRLKPAPPSYFSNEEDTRLETAEKEPRVDPHANPKDGHVDLYLPPLSLYVLSGVSRYRYTHELLPSGELFYPFVRGGKEGEGEEDVRPIQVDREDRMSVIFRDAF